MIHDIEMTSGGMIHIPYFINIGSGIHKLLKGNTYRLTDPQTSW